jgi:SAM-dependent methyltransferase
MLTTREPLDIADLVCPDCRAAFDRTSDRELVCPGCGHAFPVLFGNVPSLLPTSQTALKSEIMQWWSAHNLDLEWRRPQPGFEKGSWEYFRETDRRWFMWGRPFLHVKYPLLHKVLDPSAYAGRKMLEIGFGAGVMIEQFANAGADVTGLDLAPQHVQTVARRRELFNFRARLVHGDAERTPFADGSFDFIFSWGVLHHTPDTPRTFLEIHRILKPGGRFFAMLYQRHSWHYWVNKMFKWGLARGKLLQMNRQEIANRSSDGVLYGGNPLSQFFTVKELTSFASPFHHVRVTLTGHGDTIRLFPAKRLPLGKFVLPASLAHRMMRRVGHLAIVEGTRE